MPFDNLKRPGPQRGAGERAINLPPAILWLIAINVVVHVLRQLLSEQTDQQLILNLGLIPDSITGDQGSLLSLASLVTYQFLHGGWVHLGVNMLSLAAFGAPVERLLGVRRFVLFYLSAGIVSGLVYLLFFPGSTDPVIGASGAISGVFGAVLILMRQVGSLSSVLPIAGIWIALNVFFGYFGGTPGAGDQPVAWMAHIGGFVYGLAVVRLFVPRRPGT